MTAKGKTPAQKQGASKLDKQKAHASRLLARANRAAIEEQGDRAKRLMDQAHKAAQKQHNMAITAELEREPGYKEVNKALRSIRHNLHMGRLLIKRKGFAIKVRERKMANLPKEIAKIGQARNKIQKQVETMQTEERQLLDRLDHLTKGIEQRLISAGVLGQLPKAG